MFNIIVNNLPTIIVAALLVLTLALIVRKMLKDKKNGKSSCACSCESCPGKGICHTK